MTPFPTPLDLEALRRDLADIMNIHGKQHLPAMVRPGCAPYCLQCKAERLRASLDTLAAAQQEIARLRETLDTVTRSNRHLLDRVESEAVLRGERDAAQQKYTDWLDDVPGYPCGCGHDVDTLGIVTETHHACDAHKALAERAERLEAERARLRQQIAKLQSQRDKARNHLGVLADVYRMRGPNVEAAKKFAAICDEVRHGLDPQRPPSEQEHP